MAQPNLIEDGEILWLAITKVGNPPVWQPGANYNMGDIIVPTTPDANQLNLAFQCVGFLKKSSSSEPVFPVTANAVIISNQIEWLTVDPATNPAVLDYNQYYLISQEVVVT